MLTLSRTKIERADDLGLPPRTLVIRRDYFSPAEKELYMSLFTNAKREFNTYVEAGTVLNSELAFLGIEADPRLLQHFLAHYEDAPDGVSP